MKLTAISAADANALTNVECQSTSGATVDCPEDFTSLSQQTLMLAQSEQAENNAPANTPAETEAEKEEASCDGVTPIIPFPDQIMVMLLQIVCPGLGAMVAAYRAIEGFHYGCFCCGLFQLLTIPIFGMGAIWSIIHGIIIYTKSSDYWNTKYSTNVVDKKAL